MEFSWYSIITTVLTIVAGGGWFVYYKANKRKANGEATQTEAEGWKSVQDMYQQMIADMKEYNEGVKADRDNLFKENNELRKMMSAISTEMEDLKRTQARQGRQLESMRPLMCGDLKCKNRKKVNVMDEIVDDQN